MSAALLCVRPPSAIRSAIVVCPVCTNLEPAVQFAVLEASLLGSGWASLDKCRGNMRIGPGVCDGQVKIVGGIALRCPLWHLRYLGLGSLLVMAKLPSIGARSTSYHRRRAPN